MESAATARDEAALELDRMTIRSPIAGYVQRRLKGPGDKVVRMMDDPHSAHVLHVYDPSRLQVRVDVPLADAGSIVAGQRCEIVVEILPDRKLAGRVLRVTHEADVQKNTLQIKVAVDEPLPLLRPEMLTRVTFLAGSGSVGAPGAKADPSVSRVKIPVACLDDSEGQVRVWLVTDRSHQRGVLTPVVVRAVERAEGWVTVEGAIQPGSLVASRTEGLKGGQVVRFEADRLDGSAQR
jgi:multidrug efflux pump subunit AcrA (membrane-fusion protein)